MSARGIENGVRTSSCPLPELGLVTQVELQKRLASLDGVELAALHVSLSGHAFGIGAAAPESDVTEPRVSVVRCIAVCADAAVGASCAVLGPGQLLQWRPWCASGASATERARTQQSAEHARHRRREPPTCHPPSVQCCSHQSTSGSRGVSPTGRDSRRDGSLVLAPRRRDPAHATTSTPESRRLRRGRSRLQRRNCDQRPLSSRCSAGRSAPLASQVRVLQVETAFPSLVRAFLSPRSVHPTDSGEVSRRGEAFGGGGRNELGRGRRNRRVGNGPGRGVGPGREGGEGARSAKERSREGRERAREAGEGRNPRSQPRRAARGG